jgi:hypothetical protein
MYRLTHTNMKKERRRFFIYRYEGPSEIRLVHLDTLAECYQWGLNNDEEWQLWDCYVRDWKEDIDVYMDDVMECFARGETPMDLHFF